MNTLIPRQGTSYRKLLSYQKAEVVFDITYYFCQHFLSKGDRTVDQMIQAARSGKQNIIEGCAASSTSKETEIKLINVAKASLQELLADYEDYLRTHQHEQWPEHSEKWEAMRQVGIKHSDSTYYRQLISTHPAETIANISIILIKQTDYLLYKQLKSLSQKFLTEGGFRERMTRMRLEEREKERHEKFKR